ncbi:MAG: hypothetical protein U1E76_17015 [Planctomycetota bacterium]
MPPAPDRTRRSTAVLAPARGQRADARDARIRIGLLAAECYYRFWYDTTDSFGLTRTTSRWFKRYYALNRMGFRDNVEYAHTRPRVAGACRSSATRSPPATA